jgi:hypothetical protein
MAIFVLNQKGFFYYDASFCIVNEWECFTSSAGNLIPLAEQYFVLLFTGLFDSLLVAMVIRLNE